MAALFTDEAVRKAMEQCNWEKNHRFVLAADLKPRRLANALANIAPELRKEDVVAFRDDSLLHSGKSGWILTSDKIYFHKDYQLSSDPYHKHHFDFSKVKRIEHTEKSNYVTLIFQDDTRDSLNCVTSYYGGQIYEFLACIMRLYNAGFYDDSGLQNDINQMLHRRSLSYMEKVFGQYPSFVPLRNLPDKQVILLKKHLNNPFLEQIVAFNGNIDKYTAYGHLFTTEYYYFLSGGRVADHISLWELEDIYPHHSDHEMTAILKDGTVRPLDVGTGISTADELEAALQEIIARRQQNTPRGLHLNESPQEEERRARISRKMFQIQNRSIERPYTPLSGRDLYIRCKKLEAAGETEDLPFFYEKIGYQSSPPDDSFFYAKAYLHMPLSRHSLSYVYYYLYCLKHNLRFCDHKIRCYQDLDYRVFIKMCNETPLEEVREQLRRKLDTYHSRWLSD